MRKGFTKIELLVVIAICLILLGLVGFLLPAVLLFHLAFGWVFYFYRVLPQVRFSGVGFLTAAICMGTLAIGLQWFFRWFVRQMPSDVAETDSSTLYWPPRRTGVILGLVMILFIAGIAVVGIGHQVGWLLSSPGPIVSSSFHSVISRVESQNSLKQMALAMHNYQEMEKTMPPATIFDRQGQPLLSWRVLILPYIEEESLYKQFHLDEPWDSPHNLRLLPRMPRLYAPRDRSASARPYRTPYQVFVGKGAAFEGKQGLHLPEDFPDGTANTILIVVTAELVPWTKPADLPFDRRRPLPALGWSTEKVFSVAMADGSVRIIHQQTNETTLRAAITRNGGDTLGPDW